MTAKIVVGHDGSPQGDDALALARLLTSLADARLLVVCVYPPWPRSPSMAGAELEKINRENAERVLREVGALVGDDIEHRAVMSGSAAQGLHEVAEQEGAELIVVGSTHRSGAMRTGLGSVGARLLHGAPCAVAVAPAEYRAHRRQWRTIAVGYDVGQESLRALRLAERLARATGAQLRLVAVSEDAPRMMGIQGQTEYAEFVRAMREEREKELEEATTAIDPGLRPEPVLLQGDAGELLIEYSREGADLLVIGSRGYGLVRQVLLGGVSHRLAHGAGCPLVVVPRGVEVTLFDGGFEKQSGVP